MDDGTSDSKFPSIRSYYHAYKTVGVSEDDRKEWYEAINNCPAVDRSKSHGAETDEREEADDGRRVRVRRRREQESECRPVGGEYACYQETHDTGLNKDRMFR